MTRTSPDAGRKSCDRPPPKGRTKNGLALPSVTMATIVSLKCLSSRSAWNATLSWPSR